MSNALGMMEKPLHSEDWYASYLEIIRIINVLAAPDNCYFVSPAFADGDLGADIASATGRRMFATLQEAHDALPAGSSYNGRSVVFVFPGTYAENLTITKTITYRAALPSWYRALGGLRSVELVGASTVQSPLITINPANSTEVVANFSGFIMENLYSQAAGSIVKAQIAKLNAQSIYGSRQNGIGFIDCDIRMQTYGNGNEWWAGIWAAGWADVNIRRCNIAGLSYGGGSNNAGVSNLIMCLGENGNGKACQLRIYDSAIAHYYKGTVIPTPSVVYMDNLASGYVFNSALLRSTSPNFVNGSYKTIGATGVNTFAGTDGDYTQYKNTLGLDMAGL